MGVTSMSNDVENQEGAEDESSVIKDLRKRLKIAEQKAETSAAEARAKVTREAKAKSLMPDEYAGFADLFESETDGDLTPESLKAWLTGRGIATSESTDETVEVTDTAQAVADVADLGAAAAAAASVTTTPVVTEQIESAADGLHNSGDLPELMRRLEAALEG